MTTGLGQPLPADPVVWQWMKERDRQDMARYAKENPNAHVNAGKSIYDIIWEELDVVMDRIMEDGPPDKNSLVGDLEDGAMSTEGARELAREWWEALRGWGEERGQAQGLAYVLAVMKNPYAVDVDAIREEAKHRWEERSEG